MGGGNGNLYLSSKQRQKTAAQIAAATSFWLHPRHSSHRGGGDFEGTFGLRSLKPWEVFQCDCGVVAACQRVRATVKYEVFNTKKG